MQMPKPYYEKNKEHISREVAIWENPHNEFLLHAATRGTIGVVALLMMLGSLLWLFGARIRSGIDGNVHFAAVSGAMIVMGYVIYGLSIALFEHRDFTLYYILYVPLFAASVIMSRKQIS